MRKPIYKTLKMDAEQSAIVEEIATRRYSSLENFGRKLVETAERLNHGNEYMYPYNLPKYLSGKAKLSVRPARVFLETLGEDTRLGFLKEIASQRLLTDPK